MSSVIPGELPNSGSCHDLAPLTSSLITPISQVLMHILPIFSHSAPKNRGLASAAEVLFKSPALCYTGGLAYGPCATCWQASRRRSPQTRWWRKAARPASFLSSVRRSC